MEEINLKHMEVEVLRIHLKALIDNDQTKLDYLGARQDKKILQDILNKID